MSSAQQDSSILLPAAESCWSQGLTPAAGRYNPAPQHQWLFPALRRRWAGLNKRGLNIVGKGGEAPDPAPSPAQPSREFEPWHPRSVLRPDWDWRAAKHNLEVQDFHPFLSCWKLITILCPQSWGGHGFPPPRRGGAGLGSPRELQNSSPCAKVPPAQQSQTLGVLRAPQAGTRGYLLIYFLLPPLPPLLTNRR